MKTKGSEQQLSVVRGGRTTDSDFDLMPTYNRTASQIQY